MSPDLTDNIILLCGGMIYDCYRMLRDDAGVMRKTMPANDMLSLLNINDSNTPTVKKKKIRNSAEILNALSVI